MAVLQEKIDERGKTIKTKAPLLSIIILNYQTNELTLDLLKNLGNHNDCEILVIDNNPSNELQPIIEQTYPYVKYHYPAQNMGFAGGNNYGIGQAIGEWFFLLNNDTKVTVKEIFKLVDKARTSHMLAAAPQLIYPDGKVQNTAGYFDSLAKNTVNWLFARPRFLDCSTLNEDTKVDICTGAALLLHTSVVNKLQFLDDRRFFMYFEDIDLSYRMYKKHISILYVPEIKVVHYGGATSDKDKNKKNEDYNHSREQYIIKHRGSLINNLNKKLKLFA